MDGFTLAFSEITLVLFTTLAPSGAVAYLVMGLPVLAGRARGEAARRLNKWACLPLVVAMVGLIASATHLGNPSNALYVFTGVGRSPLSTEVFAAVIFLALAGVFWLYSFAEHPRIGLQRGLLAVIDVAIVAFVIAVAFAYNVDTILTWSLPLVPVSLMLNSLFGGPLLAFAGFAVADYDPGRRGAHVLLALATAACVANVAVYAVLGFQLQDIENELVSAASLVAGYPVYLAAFALFAAGALILAWRAETKRESRRLAADRPLPGGAAAERSGDARAAEEAESERTVVAPMTAKRSRAPLVVASILAFAALFLMRFTFYMSHLTVGLGV